MSYLERPDPDELSTVGGYVVKIWVEQSGERDQLKFSLEIFYLSVMGELATRTWDFNVYLDIGTTVALAQLQLLRDALANTWYTEVEYHFDDDAERRDCYYVKIHSPDIAPYPTIGMEAYG